MAANFGKRPLAGAPTTGRPAPAPLGQQPPPRRLRSRAVVIGAIGALTLSFAAAAEWREHRCRPRAPDDPDPRPAWCDSHGGSFGHSSGSFSGVGHASFGGFGAHGSGHGGG